MAGNYEKDHDRLNKQIALQYMKNLLVHLKKEESTKNEINKSFVYLENNTLDTLLMYLVTQMSTNNVNTHSKAEVPSREKFVEINNTIDDLLNDQEIQFEELISLIKSKVN